MPKGKPHSVQFKFKVALEAAKGTRTLNELASEYGLHPSQISDWKQQLLAEGPSVFSTHTARQQREQEALQAELYEQIGRLKMELEWLKKKLPNDAQAKRALVEPDHPQLSIRRQCELVGLNRSTFYYQPARESDLNLCLMRLIDKQYTRTPFYGWPRMTAYLRQEGYAVNPKRVRRLMRQMGLQAVPPKRQMTVPSPEHKVYPYLLRNVPIMRTNQVWSAEIV
jgi:putative transposase